MRLRVAIPLALAAAAIFALFAWGSASLLLRQERAEVTGHAAASITAMQAQDELHLLQTIRQAEQEVRFIAGTPPVAGIGRALLNNGLDSVEGNTLAQWRARLEQICQSYVTARPEVFQLRVIGVADGGRELIRVVQDRAGTVTVAGADGWQQKGNTAYFRAAVGLPEGAVHVSPIDLNVEHDRIERPHRPTLRAAMPVRNDRGEVFAVAVLNMHAQPLLDLIGGGHGMPDVQEWVTDAAGHYLSHPQPGKAFDHLLNPPGTTWQEEFTPAPDAVRPEGLPADADAAVLRAPDGADWLIFTRTLHAPEADGTGGVVLHSGIPLQVLAARAWQGVTGQVIVVWAMGLVVIGLGTLLLLRWERLTRPEAAVAFAADDPSERRAWYAGAGVAVVVLLLGGGGWWFVRGQWLAEAREDCLFRAELVGQHLKTGLQSAAHAARVLAELRPETLSSQAEFERRAAELNGVSPETLVLQWSPQAIVRFSQPLAGNEIVIGYDLRADPRVRDLIARTIQTGQPFWDGPFPLRQGGIGMVYRVPVYRAGAPVSEQDFLGLATCLVNLNEIADHAATSRPLFHFAASVQSGDAAPVDLLPAVPGADAASAATAEASLALDPSDPLAADTVRFKVTAALKDPPAGGHWLALALIGAMAALFGSLAHVMETRRAGRHRLLQLSARLERSAQAVKVGFGEINFATRKISWSAEMFEFRGITEGEIDGTLEGVRRFTHPEDRELLAAAIRDARPNEPFIIEFRVVRPDGQIRWLESRGVLQTDASGQPVRFVGSETDITKRKAAELALRESEAKFRDLWETNRDAQVLCFPPEFKLTGGNAAAVALFGARDADHLATMTPGDLSPEHQPDGELSATKAQRLIGQALSQGSAFFEWTHRRPDDTVFVAEVQLTRLTFEGVTGVQASVRNITSRKLAEAEIRKLALAIARTHNAVILTDAEGRIEWVNEGFTRITGYSAAEALGRKPGQFLQGPETDPESVRRMSAAIRAGEGFRVEILNYTKTGRSYWLSIEAQPLHDAGGRLTGFMAIEADITERKLAAEKLASEQARLQSIIDASPSVIYACRVDGDQPATFVSANITEQFGYSPEECLHPGWWVSTLHPEDRDRVVAGVGALLEQGRHVHEYRMATKAGDWRWVHDELVLLRDTQGKPLGATGAILDITERKAAEAELRQFKSTLDATHDCVFMFRPDTQQFFYVNRGACDQVGYTEAELLRMHPYDIKVAYRKSEFLALIAPLLKGRQPSARFETVHRHKDGRDVPVEVFLQYVAPAGEPPRFVAIVTDIAERKAAEAAQAELLAGTNDLIQRVTPEGRMAFVNEAWCRTLGYRRDEVLGSSFFTYLHPDQHAHCRAALAGFRPDSADQSFDITLVAKDGRLVHLDGSVGVKVNADGQLTTRGIFRDVTERQQMTDQLRERLAERETLLREVHHRVKNNLQVVTSLLSMQQTRAASPEIAAEFQVSRDRIAAIALVHEQLYSTGHLDRVELAGFIRELGRNSLQASNTAGRVRFEVTGEGFPIDLQAAVPCALLVNELLTNALKHAFPGDRTGTIEVELKVDADLTRHVFVRDDGVGMDPASAKGAATSLGIRLVRRLADQLGARLEWSPSAAGTEFHLTLPPSAAEDQCDAA